MTRPGLDPRVRYAKSRRKLGIAWLQTGIPIIVSYWVFQGFLYMQREERILKVAIELALALPVLSLLGAEGVGPWPVRLAATLAISHTLNMLVNGHFFAVLVKAGLKTTDPARIGRYARDLGERWQGRNAHKAVLAYGGLARRQESPTSDLDVRVLARPDCRSRWTCALLVWAERFRALASAFPIDIYLARDEGMLDRMRETPIMLAGRTDPVLPEAARASS